MNDPISALDDFPAPGIVRSRCHEFIRRCIGRYPRWAIRKQFVEIDKGLFAQLCGLAPISTFALVEEVVLAIISLDEAIPHFRQISPDDAFHWFEALGC